MKGKWIYFSFIDPCTTNVHCTNKFYCPSPLSVAFCYLLYREYVKCTNLYFYSCGSMHCMMAYVPVHSQCLVIFSQEKYSL